LPKKYVTKSPFKPKKETKTSSQRRFNVKSAERSLERPHKPVVQYLLEDYDELLEFEE